MEITKESAFLSKERPTVVMAQFMKKAYHFPAAASGSTDVRRRNEH